MYSRCLKLSFSLIKKKIIDKQGEKFRIIYVVMEYSGSINFNLFLVLYSYQSKHISICMFKSRRNIHFLAHLTFSAYPGVTQKHTYTYIHKET